MDRFKLVGNYRVKELTVDGHPIRVDENFFFNSENGIETSSEKIGEYTTSRTAKIKMRTSGSFRKALNSGNRVSIKAEGEVKDNEKNKIDKCKLEFTGIVDINDYGITINIIRNWNGVMWELVILDSEKWLTTGQLIDQLKVSEVAESEDGKYNAKMTDYNMIVFQNEGGNVGLNEKVLNAKWHILPTYVTFEEAMKALKEGTDIVAFHPNKNTKLICNKDRIVHNSNSWLGDFMWRDLLEGKWTIENN